MPAWLAAAVRLLAGTPARAGLTGLGVGSLVPDIPGIPGLDILGGGEEKKRRRRRRRALTASDRADIGFIVGLLGPAAGKQFAITIVTKTAS